MNRFSIDKLSEASLDALSGWFRARNYNLYEAGNSEEEMAYLKAIEEVAIRTGATNIQLADYILRLEERLNLIESYVLPSPNLATAATPQRSEGTNHLHYEDHANEPLPTEAARVLYRRHPHGPCPNRARRPLAGC